MRTSVDVHNALVERDVAHELVPVRGRLRGPDRIPAVLGLSPSEVGRVRLYESEGRIVAAVASIETLVDPARVASAAGWDACREVRPSKGSALTGFLYEALPPVGLPHHIRVIVDEALANAEVLYFPGGEVSTVLKVRGPDLVRATEATVAPIGEGS